jgi:hypothetical protein
MGARPGHRGMGHNRARDRQMGAQRDGTGSQVPPTRRERRGSGGKSKAQGKAGCTCEAGAGCAAVHADTRSDRCSVEGRVHV